MKYLRDVLIAQIFSVYWLRISAEGVSSADFFCDLLKISAGCKLHIKTCAVATGDGGCGFLLEKIRGEFGTEG